MRTSCASLSWARPAIRRACSSGVSVSSSPRRFALSVAAVEAVLLDRARDRGRDEPVDRLAPGDPLAHLARRDRRRGELEGQHAVAVALEVGRRVARARADREPNVAQHLVRLLPGREGGALVGADDEDRVAEAAVADGVDRERVLVELDLVGEVEREPREPQALVGRRDDLAVARAPRRRARAAGRSAAARARPARAPRDRPAAGRSCRRGSRSSLELEHLALDLDLVAELRADLAQRSLELLLRAGRAVHAEAAVGAQDAEAAALVGLGPVDEEVRQPALVELRRLGRRAELEQRRGGTRRRPRRSRPRGRRRARTRGSSGSKTGGSGSRSSLFSTTTCGRSARPAPYSSSSWLIAAKASAGSPAAASIRCTSSRARSRCARNSWPSPTPSLAPSIRPGTSATTSWRSSESTVPSTGCSVVNG